MAATGEKNARLANTSPSNVAKQLLRGNCSTIVDLYPHLRGEQIKRHVLLQSSSCHNGYLMSRIQQIYLSALATNLQAPSRTTQSRIFAFYQFALTPFLSLVHNVITALFSWHPTRSVVHNPG
jgi:hypothetical protein